MATAQTLRKDAEELLRLQELAESPNVKRILSVEAEKMKQLAEREELASSAGTDAAAKPLRSSAYTSKITNYAWDQSDKFLKIYVNLTNVHTFDPENVTASFSPKSFELQALGPDKNNVLSIKNLLHSIIPGESYHKVKTDMIVLYLKKAGSEHWGFVTESEKKAKDMKAPKFDKEEDPGANLMSLMKQMYDEGDDEMKRTIAKAWTEARDKKPDDDKL